MNRILFTLLLLININSAFSQIESHITWSHNVKDLGNGEYEIKFTGTLDKGWHTYSKNMGNDVTPLPGSATFTPSKDYKLIGDLKELGNHKEVYEPLLKEHYIELSGKFSLVQKVKLLSQNAAVKASIDYQICNEERCLPPDPYEVEITLTGTGKSSVEKEKNNTTAGTEIQDTGSAIQDTGSVTALTNHDKEIKPDDTASASGVNQQFLQSESMELWKIFIYGFLGGLLALLTPCVFPMVPLTVSFFTKRSHSRKKGIANAFAYGLSIIVIYVALGFIVTKVFGSDALNNMASNVYFNLAFFVIFIVFAISFLGAFEIVLPSSWVNKSESMSDRGGWIGIFFMAFTLTLVSFSCTGPIIGTLLVQAAMDGHNSGPLMGMFGFSLALALPFGLFAMFPSWLHTLPKSGGWLNSVKVVFGFLELALALKFLSNADLAYHWGILDRETFLSLWIVIFFLLGLYLLGKLKFSHDSDMPHVSIPRLFMALISFSFAVYMIPGLWGAPLKAISAFAPPESTQDFNLSRLMYSSSPTSSVTTKKKYSDIFHTPYGIDGYYDYEEGMAAAREQKKPVMLDFTGWSCFNCRKMEVAVWSDAQVLKRLKEEYILISMYVDDRTELPKEEQYTTPNGKKIVTLGNHYSYIESSVYKTNTQPFYVLIDNEGKLLNTPRSYDEDIAAYIQWLDEGISKYKKGRN